MTGARAARIANSHVGRTFTLARDAVRVVDSAVDGAGVTLAAATALPRGVVAAETPFREWATRSAAFARSVGGAVLTPFESESDTFRDTVALALCLLNERFGGKSSYASTLPESFDFSDAARARSRSRGRRRKRVCGVAVRLCAQ